MTHYVVFEAGSRAGLSAKYLFLNHKNKVNTGDRLLLVDSDPIFKSLHSDHIDLQYVTYDEYERAIIDEREISVFPADELTRQSKCNHLVSKLRHVSPFWLIEDEWYDKVYVNNTLQQILGLSEHCSVHIPKTFNVKDVFIKPASLSAGSKGVSRQSNVCISENIDIKNEYVIDVLMNRDIGQVEFYGREVKLKHGYDQYIKFIDSGHSAITAVKSLIHALDKSPLCELFNGIFHIQIAKGVDDKYYYIEASKRISGTSLVNIVHGFDPFDFIATLNIPKKSCNNTMLNRWYRYEDLLEKVITKIHNEKH